MSGNCGQGEKDLGVKCVCVCVGGAHPCNSLLLGSLCFGCAVKETVGCLIFAYYTFADQQPSIQESLLTEMQHFIFLFFFSSVLKVKC